MKIRTGFVSNSSSSSFIVATDKDNLLKFKITIEVDLNDFHLDRIKDISEIKYYDDEIIKQTQEAIQAGKTVYRGEFESCGGSVELFLHNYGIPKSDNYQIIYNESGH